MRTISQQTHKAMIRKPDMYSYPHRASPQLTPLKTAILLHPAVADREVVLSQGELHVHMAGTAQQAPHVRHLERLHTACCSLPA